MSNPELLKQLFKEYGLVYDKENPQSKANDVYVHKHYTIITRQGVQKIEKKARISCNIDIVPSISTPTNVTMRGVGVSPDGQTYITFASASTETSTNKYYAEMAEKRCRARLVLTLAGLYELGVFSEDESETFSSAVKEQRDRAVPVAIYKDKPVQ